MAEETTASVGQQRSGVDGQHRVATTSGSLVESITASLRSSAPSSFSRRRSHAESSDDDSRARPISTINFPIINESIRNILNDRTFNENGSHIPIPMMPYESRSARFVQLAVMVLCLVSSLIITLVGGRGQLGISTASYLYNNAIVQKSVRQNVISNYPNLSMPVVAAVIPSEIERNMANVGEPFDTEQGRDSAVYWYVSKSGAKLVGVLLFHCLGLVEASNMGSAYAEQSLKVLEDEELMIHFVNVDTTTREGISHAKSVGLGLSGIADVIGTPLVSDIVNIFDPSHRGRFFTIMRNPIERASLLFEDEKLMNPGFDLTIINFLQSTRYQGNFLTRSLTNKPSGEIIAADLLLAKSILLNKFIVGLYDKLEESFERFEKYFGWGELLMTDSTECVRANMASLEKSKSWDDHPSSYLLPIMRENEYDIQLYKFAEEVFELQSSLTPL